MTPAEARTGPFRLIVSTLPAVLLLMGVIVYGTAEMTHAQLLRLGERWYPGYHELRADPQSPDCDPESYKPAEQPEDLFEGILPEGEGGAAAPAEAPTGEPDILDDILGAEETDTAAAQQAAEAARQKCIARHEKFASIQGRITPEVRRFRAIETGVAQVVNFGVSHQRQVLALLLLICAATATGLRGHISLRPQRFVLDHRISESVQLLANLLLLYSAWAYKKVDEAAGVQTAHTSLHYIWLAGLSALAALNVRNLVFLPPGTEPGGGIRSLMSIPLYTVMALISAVWFIGVEGHAAGLAIHLDKLIEHAILYIHVGLYVWVGMLLKRTLMAPLAFDVLRPWRLPPELLAFVVVVGAALPTAYSGASGIFVIAAGAVIYEEMRAAGARRQLALAATAMSGSLGVVLRPCLLVVIVAALNKQVTTDQLYTWGGRVFLLTALLFFAAVLLTRQNPIRVASPGVAAPASVRALGPLLPYAAIIGGILLFDALLLDVHLDEHSAPLILPLILLVVLIYDRWHARRTRSERSTANSAGWFGAVRSATSETTGHIGALLMLMGLSVAIGGVIERAEVMSMFPESFGSAWTTMGLLVFVLVIVGMTMDPYGAVILVSATIADVAYRNGIDAVHFWMVVLVAFELGYLTPPVALNHLLTRQVVGEHEAEAAQHEGGTFWHRHERILLPVVTMGIALALVAFVPLFFYG